MSEYLAETRNRAALTGAVSVGLALGLTELATGIFDNLPWLPVAAADRVIDFTPAPVVHFAISVLGTNDKLFLVSAIVLLLLWLGAQVGQMSSKRGWWFGLLALAGLGVVGAFSAAVEQGASIPLVAVTTLAAVAAGGLALYALLRVGGVSPAPKAQKEDEEFQGSRRQFLGLLGGLALIALAAGVGGRALATHAAEVTRNLVRLPRPAQPAPPVPTGASLSVDGITEIVTPNDAFYRIDTAIDIPQVVDSSTWSLNIKGMVDRPYKLSFADLLSMRMVEEFVTLTCVSNEVGGNLAGNARWLGVPLKDVLTQAGVKSGATQLIGRSVDGFTVGIPTEAVFDGRVAMVAVGMNGVPLPSEHGFPARLVISGLYGYVSATKWLSELELTTFQAFDSFWVQRGWSRQAPIKTESRIDVPQNGNTLPAGKIAIAGVAWAQTRGISQVEVQVDNGPWQEATLADPIGVNCWRQWVLYWQGNSGQHTVAVRATDGTGVTQTAQVEPPVPDGATGYHTIAVTVS